MDAESHNECRVRFLFFWPLQLYLKGYCNRITADSTMFPFFSAYSLLPHRCCTNTVGLAAAKAHISLQPTTTQAQSRLFMRTRCDCRCRAGASIISPAAAPPITPRHRYTNELLESRGRGGRGGMWQRAAGQIRIQANRS